MKIGRTYGVIKFVGGDLDKPHWSTGTKMRVILPCLSFLFALSNSLSAPNADDDFIVFVKNAEYCQTLAGEAGDLSEADAAALNKCIDIACGTAKKKYTILMRKAVEMRQLCFLTLPTNSFTA